MIEPIRIGLALIGLVALTALGLWGLLVYYGRKDAEIASRRRHPASDGDHDRLPEDERAELDGFDTDFRDWSIDMWRGLDADRIARRRERVGWDR